MVKPDIRQKKYDLFHKQTKVQLKIVPKNNFTYRNIISYIDKYLKNKEQKVVDIGCGAGTICFYIANEGNNVSGFDISSKAIKACKESSRVLNLDNLTRFKIVDFPEEYVEEKFDLIIFSEVIEHLRNDSLALKRIYTMLNKGGIVIITTPSIHAPLYRLGYAKSFDKRVGHLRRYTVEGLSKQCEDIGLKVIEVGKTEGILRNFLFLNPIMGKIVRLIKFSISDVVAFIDNITIPIFGESNIIIIAQRNS
jgi:SAM-dependent methyltransferase